MLAIACALFSEAKPLIEKLRLLPDDSSKEFKIYKNEKYLLLITGVGKENSYIAVSYLFGRYEEDQISSFVNVGIAGSKDLPLGSAFLAHKISCKSKKNSFYPLILFDFDGSTKEVISDDGIEKTFEKEALYDMEAFFQFEAASHFLSFEMIHSIKIVSDTSQSPSSLVNKKMVEGLIQNNLSQIEDIFEKLIFLSSIYKKLSKEPINFEFSNIHLTFSEKHQLEDLLRRANLLNLNNLFSDLSLFKKYQNAKELLIELENKIKFNQTNSKP